MRTAIFVIATKSSIKAHKATHKDMQLPKVMITIIYVRFYAILSMQIFYSYKEKHPHTFNNSVLIFIIDSPKLRDTFIDLLNNTNIVTNELTYSLYKLSLFEIFLRFTFIAVYMGISPLVKSYFCSF